MLTAQTGERNPSSCTYPLRSPLRGAESKHLAASSAATLSSPPRTGQALNGTGCGSGDAAHNRRAEPARHAHGEALPDPNEMLVARIIRPHVPRGPPAQVVLPHGRLGYR